MIQILKNKYRNFIIKRAIEKAQKGEIIELPKLGIALIPATHPIVAFLKVQEKENDTSNSK